MATTMAGTVITPTKAMMPIGRQPHASADAACLFTFVSEDRRAADAAKKSPSASRMCIIYLFGLHAKI
jgi:hypothetical protein